MCQQMMYYEGRSSTDNMRVLREVFAQPFQTRPHLPQQKVTPDLGSFSWLMSSSMKRLDQFCVTRSLKVAGSRSKFNLFRTAAFAPGPFY